jgi:hypothetical protein
VTWDSSIREEPLGEFCRIHAFYDCPICKGEEPVWVIPIENANDEYVGNVFVREGGSVTITGSPDLPEPPQTVIVHLPAVSERADESAGQSGLVRGAGSLPGGAKADHSPGRAAARSETTVEIVPRLPRPTKRQLAAAAALFADPPSEEWMREASARGRKIHDDAVALAAKEDIPYAEAIQRVLDESA